MRTPIPAVVAAAVPLLAMALAVLLLVVAGLVRVVRGPGPADRMMGAQLLGTGGIAVLLLFGAARGESVVDVALTLALLAAFASIAFVHYGVGGEGRAVEDEDAR